MPVPNVPSIYTPEWMRKIQAREQKETAMPNPDDASTSTPYRDVLPERVFRTASGFRGTKRHNGQCVDHRSGGDVLLEADTECWPIVIGGWL